MGATPMLIVNGGALIRATKLNFNHGALSSGQDNRSNACIGRAVKLVLQNCGQAALGGTESTTIGGPRKFSMCLAENEEALNQCTPAWFPFRGKGNGVVTVHAVSSGGDQFVDFASTAEELIEGDLKYGQVLPCCS
jgi:hypothetical protein